MVARKDQHDSIRPLIEQLDGPGETEVKQELAVFRLNQLDGLSVQTALQPLLPKNAQVMPTGLSTTVCQCFNR